MPLWKDNWIYDVKTTPFLTIRLQGWRIQFDRANRLSQFRKYYREAFYQKFNTNGNFLRYSLPSVNIIPV